MVKDSLMVDQDVVLVVQPPANAPVAEFRMCSFMFKSSAEGGTGL